MSTHDVPGANPANGDKLKIGCWAEAADGSLVFVKSTEGNRVIYDVFDPGPPVVQYQDGRAIDDFNAYFQKGPIKWTWHDKTPMPWDRVIKAGVRPVGRLADPDDIIAEASHIASSRRKLRTKSAAQMVAEDLQLQGRTLTEDEAGRLDPDKISELRKLHASLTHVLSGLDE